MNSQNRPEKQVRISNALLVAQSFQMSKMNKSLESVSRTMEINNQIQTAIFDVQKDIKKVQEDQLKESIKVNKLKEYEIEQSRLRFEHEQSEKEYIRSQRNLAFELKNSVQEVEKSDSTILEKYFFLKTSLEIFEELDTEKFQISEMEYAREAFNSMTESKNKYESLLTEVDISDLNKIKNIELEDENQDLYKLYESLREFEIFKKSLQELRNIKTKNISSSSTKLVYMKKINGFLKELENL